jgi:integrase
MGRKPTKNLNLPAGMRARKRPYGTYYYLDTGKEAGKPRKEIPLGSDYVAAVRKWAELTMSDVRAGALITFRTAAERYLREELPKKAPATQELNLRELASLYKFFDAPPVMLDEIDPVHVRQYLDWRVQATIAAKHEANSKRRKQGKPELPVAKNEGHVSANREKALLSHIWNFARSKGLTNKANPCAGIKGHTESGRDVYVEDDVYNAVHEAAEQPLRDAMDLAYLTGQRPADVLKLTRADIKDGAVSVQQNKTGAKLRITIEGELAELIERIGARKVMGLSLVNMMDGTPMSRFELRGALDRARAAAAAAHPALAAKIKQFQFRDLRAKAATDKEESHGMGAAQDQLGHSTPAMTKHYVRHRKGKLVKPTK